MSSLANEHADESPSPGAGSLQLLSGPAGQPLAWMTGGLLPEHKPIEEFLLWCVARDLQRKGIQNYYYALRVFFQWLNQKDMSYRDVTHDDLPAYFEWLRWRSPTDSRRGGRPLTTTEGLRNHRNALNMFYRFHGRRMSGGSLLDWAVRGEQSPPIITVETVPYPRWARHDPRHSSNNRDAGDSHPVGVPRIVTDAQARALIDATTTSRDRFLLRLLDASGLRLGELLGLHHSDLDLRRGLVHAVHRTDSRGDARGKLARDRTIPVPRAVFEDYSDYMEQEYPQDPPDPRYVFLHSRVRTPMRPEAVYIVVKGVREQTGIDFYTPHVSRRTFATRLLRAGVGLAVVADLLGHAELDTTHSWYGFLNAEDHRDQLRDAGLLPGDEAPRRPADSAPEPRPRSVSPEDALRLAGRTRRHHPRRNAR